jgi:hypothetical protein
MAILGLVVAGIVTLSQMLHKARPRRVMRLLIRRRVLAGYVFLMTTVLLAMCTASWAIAFNVASVAKLFTHSVVGGGLLLASLAGLFWFVFLVYKTRRLLEPEHYLAAYIPSVNLDDVRDCLFQWYAVRPDDEDASGRPANAATLKAWDARLTRAGNKADPFQPIREYLKDNAFQSYDYGTAAGLRFFDSLFDASFQAIAKKPQPGEYFYLAKYLSDSCEEFFNIFIKTSSEKRQMDTIHLVARKGHLFIKTPGAEGLSTIIRCLEHLAKMADDEDEVIACIEHIRELTDAYLSHRKKAEWTTVAGIFDESCLAVTRLAETYYLQKDNPLRTVPIIGHYTGEYSSATAALVEYFDSYADLGDRYPHVYPAHYFEAIESVVEALFTRYAEIVEAGQETRGLNMTYQILARRLYTIYRTFGIDAIEHYQPELLALSIANLRRIIKPAKNLKLTQERAELTRIILELALKGIAVLGDSLIKDTRTMSAYVQVTLDKHANSALIAAALKELADEPDLDLRAEILAPFLTAVRKI